MDKFEKAFDNAHGIEFDAYRFDEPDYNALIVTEENYLEHLKVQAAGLAYYGTLAKNAEREYDELERNYKSRYNELYSECQSVILRAGQKGTAKDVDSFVWEKYQSEMERWQTTLSEAKAKRDNVASWYEAWKAKGFALSSMTSLITAGLLGPKTTITEEDMSKARERRINATEARSLLGIRK